MQRSSLSSTSSSSAIAARKVVLPLEINELPAGRKAECMMGLDFVSASDRDGVLQAKFEIKFGSGSGGIPVEIKPTIGDLLLPCTRTVDQFDAAVNRLQGFNRAETKFSVSGSSARRLLRQVRSQPVPLADTPQSSESLRAA